MGSHGSLIVGSLIAGGVAALAVCAPVRSDPAADDEAAQAARSQLMYYPSLAKSKGLEGTATINCNGDAHLALRGCSVVSEAPAGADFGTAAVAIAEQTQGNPKIALKPGVYRIVLKFSLHPPAITPNLLVTPHVTMPPTVVAMPDAAAERHYYPQAADYGGLSGKATVECHVTLEGKAEDCVVKAETPSGHGFGAAAVKLAGLYKLKPGTFDGEPRPGLVVSISMDFSSASRMRGTGGDTFSPDECGSVETPRC
ncbi:MAG: energy transducer TonB [Caulobacterales bacterium]